jgi:ubiquinone/menaquinone biosynthesis C-methylase UbiE
MFYLSKIRLYIVFFAILSLGCKDNNFNFKPSEVSESRPIDDNDTDNEENSVNVGRAIWQKPGMVIDRLGDISDKTIADIGAGTGYFSLKLAYKAKKVIAVEIEPELLLYIDSSKVKLPEDKRKRIETRLASADNPNLHAEEADIIVIINTIAYIEDIPKYLMTLKKGLKMDGIIMVIDYKMKRLPINAPPKTERVYLDKLEDMFIDAGYKIIKTDDTSLDYQYILKVQKV